MLSPFAGILSPSLVILIRQPTEKNLGSSLRVKSAKDHSSEANGFSMARLLGE